MLACPPEDESAFKLSRVRAALREAGSEVEPEPLRRPGPDFGTFFCKPVIRRPPGRIKNQPPFLISIQLA